MVENSAQIAEETTRAINDFNEGYLSGEMGYKFRTKDFLNVAFLYSNSVDVTNPDLLGKFNRNTFVFEPMAAIEKIKEQVRLDLKDLNFLVDGATSLSSFVVKAANRKILEDNNFDETLDEIPNNAVDYGSGFLKVWNDGKKLKMRSVDPFALVFNQYNFKKGKKIERLMRTPNSIVNDEKYDVEARAMFMGQCNKDLMDEFVILWQVVEDTKDGQRISVVSTDTNITFFSEVHKKPVVFYFKYDYEKRRGFPDALGRGAIEKVFNKIVQSKVNRDRLDKVMEIAAKLPFQKQVDNERDNIVGKEITKLATGVIIGHKGNPLMPLDTGGTKQVAVIKQQLSEIVQTIGQDLNVTEALQGNTLPSGTSGVLGNLLSENASSVLKEHKKDYAKFISNVYKEAIIPYILKAFDSEDDLRKYLEPNDIRLIEQSVIEYYVVQAQIDAAINDQPFNMAATRARIGKEVAKKKLISGDLLTQLRKEVQGIRTFISGEEISKAQTVAFLREVRSTFATNPALFQSPFFIATLKKEAEYDAGVSALEIDQLLSVLQQSIQENQTPA